MLWHECVIVRLVECVFWLQWRNESVIKNIYMVFSLRSHLNMWINFWVVAYTFSECSESVHRFQTREVHTYTNFICKICVYLIWFCIMNYLRCFISSVMIFVVCWWSLSYDKLCLTDQVGLNWLWYQMLNFNDIFVWWYVFGSMICDGFSIWFSDWFSVTLINIQLSVFWDLYTVFLQGRHIHT